MDWRECCSKKLVRNVKEDSNRMESLKKIAMKKFEGGEKLEDNYYSSITLLYDCLRMLLECIALEKGYKISNHECYTAFLKEILHDSNSGDKFDNFRRVRNGINYYGEEIDENEGEELVKGLKLFIEEIQNKYL